MKEIKRTTIALLLLAALMITLAVSLNSCCEEPPPSKIEFHNPNGEMRIWYTDGNVTSHDGKITFKERGTDIKITVDASRAVVTELPRPAKKDDAPSDATNIDPKFKKKE